MSLTKKIILLGAQRGGKTSLALRLKFNRFDVDQAPTIGAELYEFEQSTDNKAIGVLLWDTDSELGDQVLGQEFARGSDAAIIVADSTDTESIRAAVAMRERFLEKFPGAGTVVALNKAEEKVAEKNQRIVGLDDQPFALLCSAKTGRGVTQVIRHVISQVLDH